MCINLPHYRGFNCIWWAARLLLERKLSIRHDRAILSIYETIHVYLQPTMLSGYSGGRTACMFSYLYPLSLHNMHALPDLIGLHMILFSVSIIKQPSPI